MKAVRLTCNYLTNPLGVETPEPQLSWVLETEARNQSQTAYQVIAATSPDDNPSVTNILWDSGLVSSSQCTHVGYAGRKLHSRQRVYWKVRVWDGTHHATTWSEWASFEMGLLHEYDWCAQWIGSPAGGTDIDRPVPAPLFRRSVSINKRITRARAYITGLGYYELYINGHKVGDEVLAPGFTRYDKTVLYQTHDITEALKQGENVLGVILGNGWYNCFTAEVWDFRQAPWRHTPKFLLQTEIEFEDGERLTLTSDPSWTTAPGPIVFDGLRNGEFYDARKELPGWNAPGFDAADWKQARLVRAPGGVLRSQQMPLIEVTATLVPVSVREVRQGVWLFDLGQNIAGWAQIRVNGSTGTEIRLRYADDVMEDGSLDTSQIDIFVKSGAFQTDQYTLKGDGEEVWEPRFVYHGFRYVEVTGFPGTPTIDNLRGRVVHTAFESRGNFECSNALFNQIQQAARWSTLTNYHGIPTDCPQREKNGWTGDASLSAEQVLLNFNPASAYMKWMQDFQDVQRNSGQLPGIIPTGGWGFNWGSGPAWDSAMFLIPWYVYEYCGDVSVLARVYENMKQYVAYLQSMATDDLVEFGLGDWCPPVGGPAGHACPTVVTDTAYYFVDVDILAKAAGLLGYRDDELAYRQLADRVRMSWRRHFFDPQTGRVTGDCQTSQACALYQGLVDDHECDLVLQRLVEHVEAKDRHLDFGILGAKYVMHSLSRRGRTDLAYAIANQTTFPSWGHWFEQGATTLWEMWDGDGSHNHHMYSDISAWFYQGLAGIRPDVREPGFKHVMFEPHPVDGLTWVRASHESMYGTVMCNWSMEDNGQRMLLDITVPPNCHATLRTPQRYTEHLEEREQGMTGIETHRQKEHLVLTFGSGRYTFAVQKA